jgi:hypothetical protein
MKKAAAERLVLLERFFAVWSELNRREAERAAAVNPAQARHPEPLQPPAGRVIPFRAQVKKGRS